MPTRTHIHHLFCYLLLIFVTACGSFSDGDESVLTESPAGEATATPVPPSDTPIPTPTSLPEPTTTDPPEAESEAEEETQEEAQEEVPYMGRAPADMWTSLACSACHQLDQDQTESNRGPVGPNQGNLKERAATIASDQSAEEYVYTSIVDPNAHVADGYFENIMPSNYTEQMTEEEIRQMVKWLLDQ